MLHSCLIRTECNLQNLGSEGERVREGEGVIAYNCISHPSNIQTLTHIRLWLIDLKRLIRGL